MKKTLVVSLVLATQMAISKQTEPVKPFGFPLGASLQEIQNLTVLSADKDNKNWYETKIAPTTNNEFEAYSLMISPNYGLCKVIAYGITYKNDDYGNVLKNKFSSIESALNAKYGKGKNFDFLNYDSIWTDNKYFAMSLYKQERHLQSFWMLSTGVTLPGNLESIGLEGKALDSTRTYLVLRYESKNIKACMDEAKATDASGL